MTFKCEWYRENMLAQCSIAGYRAVITRLSSNPRPYYKYVPIQETDE